MEGVVEGDGGDRSRGWPFRVGGKKRAAPQPSPASTSIGSAFDAHFHLDRLMGNEKRNLLVDFIYNMNVSPRDKVDLRRGGGGGGDGWSSAIRSTIPVQTICGGSGNIRDSG